MSVVAMPPYPSRIPASAFSPTASDYNVWMAAPAAAARRASASIKRVRWVVEGVRRRLLVRVDDKSDRT
jgi:hypothetical protein